MTLATLGLLLLQPGTAGTSCWCLQLRQAALVGKTAKFFVWGWVKSVSRQESVPVLSRRGMLQVEGV